MSVVRWGIVGVSGSVVHALGRLGDSEGIVACTTLFEDYKWSNDSHLPACRRCLRRLEKRAALISEWINGRKSTLTDKGET